MDMVDMLRFAYEHCEYDEEVHAVVVRSRFPEPLL